MRRLFLAAVLVVPLAARAGTPQTVVLYVQNMTCAVCPITVQKALEKVPGVTEVKINFDSRIATVKFNSDKTTPAILVKATADAGFPTSPRK